MALPHLPDLETVDGVSWHAFAPCLPSPDGDRWAQDLSFGTQWDQLWMIESVCSACPVIRECLNDSFLFRRVFGRHPDGVWGGLTLAQRKRLWTQLVAGESSGGAGEAA